jgi:hypothetical protein
LKVTDDYGRYLNYYLDVFDAIQWCIDTLNDGDPDNDIHIINMSLGGPKDAGLKTMVNLAEDAGIICIGSSGNDGKFNIEAPSRYCWAIGATDQNNAKYEEWITYGYYDPYYYEWIEETYKVGSNYGWKLDFVAPGVDIETLNLWNSNNFDESYTRAWFGTSFSAPMVSGTCALLLSLYPEFTSDDIFDILKDTALDIDKDGNPATNGWDIHTGHGLINAYDAIYEAAQRIPDSDGDGVNDAEELRYGSDPTKRDTDGDWLTDYWEITNTDPRTGEHFDPDDSSDGNFDHDGDGLHTGLEVKYLGTHWLNADSDGDGWDDGEEAYYMSNPLSVHSKPTTDHDNDGLSNIYEVDVLGTNPYDRDTDDDGMHDGIDPDPLHPPGPPGGPWFMP